MRAFSKIEISLLLVDALTMTIYITNSRQGTRRNLHQPLNSNDMYPQ